MVDTSLILDYFRKTDKQNARPVSYFKNYGQLYISSITEFEVMNGAKPSHIRFWNIMLTRFIVLDFGSEAARQSAIIVAQLKTKRKSIDKPDLFIAATAIINELAFDTLNVKHFLYIDNFYMLANSYNPISYL